MSEIQVGTTLVAKKDFFMDKSDEQFLTKGDQYDVIQVRRDKFAIIDDNDEPHHFSFEKDKHSPGWKHFFIIKTE